MTRDVSVMPYCFSRAARKSGLARTACSHSICSSTESVGWTPGGACFTPVTAAFVRFRRTVHARLLALSCSTAEASRSGTGAFGQACTAAFGGSFNMMLITRVLEVRWSPDLSSWTACATSGALNGSRGCMLSDLPCTSVPAHAEVMTEQDY